MAKILVVEDNETNREMLMRRLERLNYEVFTANNGKQGIESAETILPDLIIMDLSLPVMDGWEATRHLKASPKTNNIPVIALTAHAMTGDRAKALEAGCDEYETKPIDMERLRKIIESLLQ
jgi:CheY-like chemotaxis protein